MSGHVAGLPRADDLRSGSVRTVGACGEGIRGAIESASLARMDVPRPTNARGGSCVYLATLKVAKVMLYRAMRDA